MEFRTKIEITGVPGLISYDSNVMFIGSCFANEMGKNFHLGKMNTLVNPFGVLYNPGSTAHALELMMSDMVYTDEDIYFHDNRYLSFDHDTSFSSASSEECLQRINSSLTEARRFLHKASFLFVTFGTARVFRWKKDNRLVANCHKIPASDFTRHLLNAEDITAIWEDLIDRLRRFNKDLKIIFTVSPVRHLKDGAYGNQVSKSVLFTAIDHLLAHDNKLSYFPSYEIMIDELRDYRFYKKDMIHPSDVAVEYIWERLRESYFSRDTEEIYRRIIKISEARQHVIGGNDPDALSRFKESMLTRIHRLKNDYPFIDLGEEEEYFNNI
ncbi:MAG: GSCFA domain-containing protein [Bacteroidales bacterium]|nr:GSCFA domain-containing protein [Bacteroidales bacterium]